MQMKTRLFCIIFILAITLFAFGGMFSLYPQNSPPSKFSIAWKFLKTHVYWYYIDYNELPLGNDFKILKQIFKKRNISIKSLENHYIYTYISNTFEMTDEWGTPYKISLDSYGVLVMISAGKNKIFYDDDDIFTAKKIIDSQ